MNDYDKPNKICSACGGDLGEHLMSTKYNKEKKMTREEAKKKLVEQRNEDVLFLNRTNEDHFLNKLEVLDLIKFEEENPIVSKLDAIKYCRNCYSDHNEFMNRLLHDFGYAIIKQVND